MACAVGHHSVSPPRSSNRTCGFPASGSPTGFTAWHTADDHLRLVSRYNTVARINLRLEIELCLKPPDAFWCYQAHRQSPILVFVKSAPEVRVLSSAGITRPQRYYDPVRLPPGPPCLPRRWSSDLRPKRASPDYPDHLPNVPCPLPRWIGAGAYVGCFPIPRGLPRQTGGSASTSSLSRPAQASLALRPAGSLDRPRRPLSRGFETASYPTAPLVSYQINRQLSGWHLPPLVFGAHCPVMATSGGSARRQLRRLHPQHRNCGSGVTCRVRRWRASVVLPCESRRRARRVGRRGPMPLPIGIGRYR